jgi:pyruvate formate-lyase/glycerol dehydratase family glycyl radical enzyme
MLDTMKMVMTIKPTPRIGRLKEAYLNLKPTASIDRARIETKVMRETEGEPMVKRRAKVFAAVAREMPVEIYPDELIVGCHSVRPYCENVSPADGPNLEAGNVFQLTSLDHYDPSAFSDEDKRALREELIPYWKGQGKYENTRQGRILQRLPSELADLIYADPKEYPPKCSMIYCGNMGLHYGHNCVGYDKVLKNGFLGIKKEAEDKLASLDSTDPDDLERIPFVEGVIMAMEAAAEVGKRLAAKARELAAGEKDTKRKSELLNIAKVCDWVPANPARTFHEALQSYYLTWMMLFWETPYCWSVTPGRADQYLYPYYQADMKKKRITKEDAQELIDCYFIKLNLNQTNKYHHVSVGGIGIDGNDATNELSYMFIEAMMHTKVEEPILSVMLHSKSPDDLLIKACQLCSMGTGHPQFLNSEVMLSQALARGSLGGPAITLEDARSACPIGCIELGIPGKDSGYGYFAVITNLAAAMEFVMTNGFSRRYGRKMGLETGDPRQFKSFEEVKEAYRKQVAWIRRNRTIDNNIEERVIAELSPTVYESALIEGCIEKGIPRELGGAYYNFNTGVVGAGSSDAADSLTAIKKLVFEDKKITMDQLCDALDKNFEGYDELRQMLLAVPKFGNDNDYADEQATFVSHVYASESVKQKNTRGGHCSPGGSPLAMYISCGRVVGALPSGRLAWEPLSDAWSPCAGSDLNGPTAVLKSMGKVDSAELLGGVILNMRIDPAVFKDGDGLKRLVDLIRTFIDQKIYHVQINVVSAETLRAAQKEPEKYQDLVVKVAGYNAFFVRLDRPLQDGIIARTEHSI